MTLLPAAGAEPMCVAEGHTRYGEEQFPTVAGFLEVVGLCVLFAGSLE